MLVLNWLSINVCCVIISMVRSTYCVLYMKYTLYRASLMTKTHERASKTIKLGFYSWFIHTHTCVCYDITIFFFCNSFNGTHVVCIILTIVSADSFRKQIKFMIKFSLLLFAPRKNTCLSKL